jgi:hydroxyacylglutathione hydrolase
VDEWQSGHIPEALNYSYRELSRRWPEEAKDRKVAVLCAGGVRSAIASSILENKGFKQVFNVQGGMGSWQKAGLTTIKEEGAGQAKLNLEQVSSGILDWVI